MGLALLAIIWLITFFSTYFFVAKTWWLPHGASTAAAFIDHQFYQGLQAGILQREPGTLFDSYNEG